jgi:signal transduction histidine kinase
MVSYAVSPLLCAIIASALGTFVFLKNPKSAVNRSFALLCLETFWWQACWFISYYLTTYSQKVLIVRIAYTSIVFLPFTFYHFVARFLNRSEEKKWIRNFYLLSLFWLVIIWTSNKFIAGFHQFGWGIYGKVGPLHPIYLLFVIISVVRVVHLLKPSTSDRTLSATARNHNKFIFLAYGLFCVATVEYLINYGLDFYPIGVFFILASFSVIAFAIVKYNLMGIEEAFKELLAKSLSFLSIGSITFILIISCLKLFGLKAHFLSVLIGMGAMAVILPLIRKTSALISRKLRPRPNFDAILKDFTEVDMMATHTSKGLAELVVKRITDSLKPAVCSLMLLDEETGLYNVVASSGQDEEIKTIAFKPTNHLILALSNSHQIRLIVKDELDKVFPPEQANLIKRDLEILRSQISIPLILHRELIGLFNFGPKVSGELYTPEEIGFIYIFLAQSGFLIEFLDKIQAIHKLLAEKERLISAGQVAEAMGHELGNKIYAISLGTELLAKGIYKTPDKIKETAQKILKNVEVSKDILGSVDDYKKKAKSDEVIEIDIKESIEEIITSFKDILKQNKIELIRNFPPSLPKLTANPNLPNAFRYVITGAIDAMESDGGTLTICAQVIDEGRLLEIQFSDTADDVTQSAFLTSYGLISPERGKVGGIKYFLARRIVNDHHGTFDIQSNQGKGTTFVMRLPLASPKKHPLI